MKRSPQTSIGNYSSPYSSEAYGLGSSPDWKIVSGIGFGFRVGLRFASLSAPSCSSEFKDGLGKKC